MSNRTHLIISGVIAILFLVIIQIFASPSPVFRFLVPAFLGYTLIVAVYNRSYLIKTNRWNVWVWLRTPFFLLTWFGLLFLLPSALSRGLFLLISLPIIYFFESLVGNTGQQFSWNEFLLTLAALILSLFGLSYYYKDLPGLSFLIATFLSVAFVVRSSFELVPHSNAVKWVASLAIGLFATELFWAISFLPLHYSALAIFVFNILYVLWIIYYHYLYRTLTRKQIQFHLVLALILTLIMLISTPWSIQS
jgi:hypothetical protein